MNERFTRALHLQQPDRAPFIPAIYEHKAWFVGETPSDVCRDAHLFTEALVAEYESVRPDALVVGIDVYNVEAEAIGCTVTYYDDGDTSIPAIGPDGAVVRGSDGVASLGLPDPHKDGRMPINLEAAQNSVNAFGNEIPIRGAVSGPFSMAANLVGPENLFMLIVTQPALVKDLMNFSAEVIKTYGQAFIEIGCGVVIFDSQASPELLSPAMYKDFVLGPTQNIINHFHRLGLKHVPLIIGGNTTKILDHYLQTGANNILCDVRADAAKFLEECSKAKRAFRRNIDSSDFLTATPQELRERALKYLEEAQGYPGFILGTGVVPYGTPTSNLVAIREAVNDFHKLKDEAVH